MSQAIAKNVPWKLPEPASKPAPIPLPTTLDFALRYKMPAPANLDTLLQQISPEDRRAAFDGIRTYRAECARLHVAPVTPSIYVQMRIWERLT